MLTDERLNEMTRAIRLYGSANCWTGTTGTLATMISELLIEREELFERIQLGKETDANELR